MSRRADCIWDALLWDFVPAPFDAPEVGEPLTDVRVSGARPVDPGRVRTLGLLPLPGDRTGRVAKLDLVWRSAADAEAGDARSPDDPAVWLALAVACAGRGLRAIRARATSALPIPRRRPAASARPSSRAAPSVPTWLRRLPFRRSSGKGER